MLILARALVWAALFVAFGLIFLPARLIGPTGLRAPDHFGIGQVAGIVLVLGGGVLVLGSIVTFAIVGRGTAAPFDPPRRLVTSGPFRFVRNPIYIGALLSLLGAAWYYGSLGLVAYAGVLAVGFHVLVLVYEEPTLRRVFGPAYVEYCERVHRWLPRPLPTEPGSDRPVRNN